MKTPLLLTICLLFLFINKDSKNYFQNRQKNIQPNNRLAKEQRIDALAELELEMTQNPDGIIPQGELREIRQELKKKNLATFRINTELEWEERGPNNLAGRVRTFTLDPNDPSGNTLWTGGISGGLWKCTNLKSDNYQWEEIKSYPGSPAISDILFDPINTNIVYVATGEGWFNSDAYRGDGIYKSTDGGVNWTYLESTSPSYFRYVQKLLIVGNVLYACTRGAGVLFSFDGGISWFSSLNNTVNGFSDRAADIEVNTNGEIFAGMGIFSEDGIYKTSDQGYNWTYLPFPFIEFERIEFAIAPSNPQKIYALIQDSEIDDVKYIVRSSDGGMNWDTLQAPSAFGLENFGRRQAWYDMAIDVDPGDENHLVIGAVDLLESFDGGENWNQISQWFGGNGLQYVHADQHRIQFIGADELIVANDDGIWYSNSRMNDVPVFEHKNNGFNVTQFYSCAIDNSPGSNIMMGGSQDNGTQAFNQEGLNNTIPRSGGDGGYCVIDPIDPNYQLTSFSYNSYVITIDGWKSFTQVDGKANEGYFINPTAYDAVNKIIYASAEAGSINIIPMDNPFIDSLFFQEIGDAKVSALRVHPMDPNVLLVGTNQGEIFQISNLNGSAEISQLKDLGFGFVRNIEFGNHDTEKILFTLSNYDVSSVYFSDNGGESWQDIEGNLPNMPVRWGIFHPLGDEKIILGTEMGIWTTNLVNADQTLWEMDSEGMPIVRVDMLNIRQSDLALVAATYGRGMYTSNTFVSTVDMDEDGFPETVDCDDNNPNINPGIAEMAYNGIDDDCNASTPDDDLDQDGFGIDEDCDDEMAAVNPGMQEVPYNGIDDDCDPNTLDDDLDQDGFGIDEDCDDENAMVNPLAEDIPNNDIDENCDGMDLVSSTDEIQNKGIYVFPNPTVDIINIKGDVESSFHFSIFDIQGKQIKSGQANSIIDISELSNGIYIVRLVLNGAVSTVFKIEKI